MTNLKCVSAVVLIAYAAVANAQTVGRSSTVPAAAALDPSEQLVIVPGTGAKQSPKPTANLPQRGQVTAVPVAPDTSPEKLAAVNPMTGRASSYEEKEMQLREATLEARIADQRLSIAKSYADLRSLGGVSPRAGSYEPKVPDAVRDFGGVASPRPARKAKRKAEAVVTVSPAMFEAPRIERPVLVGVMGSGQSKIALLSYGGRSYSVTNGETIPGIGAVRNITDTTASVNGQTIAIAKSTSTINLPENRETVQPGAAYAKPAPVRGVVVPGVNAAAVQPIDVGATVTSSTQPSSFPVDLYRR